MTSLLNSSKPSKSQYNDAPFTYHHGTGLYSVLKCRLDNHYQLHGITDNTTKRSLLLRSLADETLKILIDLCLPHEINVVSYKKLMKMVKTVFPSETVTSFEMRKLFYEAKMFADESVDEWAYRLIELADKCEFAAEKQAVVRDIFVLGFKRGEVQNRLMRENPVSEASDLTHMANLAFLIGEDTTNDTGNKKISASSTTGDWLGKSDDSKLTNRIQKVKGSISVGPSSSNASVSSVVSADRAANDSKSLDIRTPSNGSVAVNSVATLGSNLKPDENSHHIQSNVSSSDAAVDNIAGGNSLKKKKKMKAQLKTTRPDRCIILKGDDFRQQVMSILNKLTPEKFELLVNQKLLTLVKNMNQLKLVVNLLFEQAMKDSTYSPLFAKICLCLDQLELESDCDNQTCEGEDSVLILGMHLISCYNRCFGLDASGNNSSLNNNSWKEDEKLNLRDRAVCLITFVCELYLLDMLPMRIMNSLVAKLCENPDEMRLDCLCLMIVKVGGRLEQDFLHTDSEGDKHLYANWNACFCKLKAYSTPSSTAAVNLPKRIIYKMAEVIELKDRNFKCDSKPKIPGISAGPKTLKEIEDEIEMENVQYSMANIKGDRRTRALKKFKGLADESDADGSTGVNSKSNDSEYKHLHSSDSTRHQPVKIESNVDASISGTLELGGAQYSSKLGIGTEMKPNSQRINVTDDNPTLTRPLVATSSRMVVLPPQNKTIAQIVTDEDSNTVQGNSTPNSGLSHIKEISRTLFIQNTISAYQDHYNSEIIITAISKYIRERDAIGSFLHTLIFTLLRANSKRMRNDMSILIGEMLKRNIFNLTDFTSMMLFIFSNAQNHLRTLPELWIRLGEIFGLIISSGAITMDYFMDTFRPDEIDKPGLLDTVNRCLEDIYLSGDKIWLLKTER